MTAYQPEQWHDMFVAMAGAVAALTGLIFVAVSINLERVLKGQRVDPAGRDPSLTSRRCARPVAGPAQGSVGYPAEWKRRAPRPVTEEASVTSDWFRAGAG